MDNDEDITDPRQARLEFMLEEFCAAQQRRRLKQGIALWNRTVSDALLAGDLLAPEKLN